MKIIYNKFIPFKGFSAINLFGVVFARKECAPLSVRTVNHESIHTSQMREMLYIFFYLWYVVEWIIRLAKYRNANEAYRNISFEREAYANDKNRDYLTNRSKYEFLKYIRYEEN